MNAEHLLIAIGLLDDDLIQEAETCAGPSQRHNYGRWLAWAASLAVVITLAYGVTHIKMDSGTSAAGGTNTVGAASEASGGDLAPPSEPGASNGGAESPSEPGAPGSEGLTGDWYPAIRVDGVVYYWDTQEYIHLEPEENDIQYTTSFLNSWEPEEDGQANFLPIGLPYVVLDNGTVAVLHNEETNTWKVYDSVPPWDK